MGTIPTTCNHSIGKGKYVCVWHIENSSQICTYSPPSSFFFFFLKIVERDHRLSVSLNRYWLLFKVSSEILLGVDKAGRIVSNSITMKQILCLWRESADSSYSEFFVCMFAFNFSYKLLLCSTGWPWTHDSLALSSWMLGLYTCAIMSGF